MESYKFVFTAPVSEHYAFDTSCFNVEIYPVNRNTYQSVVEVVDFPAFSVALINSEASIVRRNKDPSPQYNARRFTFLHVLEGHTEISHHLGMTSLHPGQFTLLDNSQTRSMFVYKHLTMLQICLHEDALERYIPDPEEMAMQLLQAPMDSEELFSPLLLMWEHFKKGNMERFDVALLESLIREITTRYTEHHSPYHCSHYNLRRIVKIKKFIEQNLSDPALSVSMIAEAFDISPRYLRSLFQGSERLSHYILRRRLQESATQLLNPLNRKLSITEIAFRCGFNSTAHFARSFKSMYGETAREHRRRLHQTDDNAPSQLTPRIVPSITPHIPSADNEDAEQHPPVRAVGR